MAIHFVYILEAANGNYYTGYTVDLDRRMEQHKTGKGSKFVRAFGFQKLLYFEKHRSKSKALKREAALKRLTRPQKQVLIAEAVGIG